MKLVVMMCALVLAAAAHAGPAYTNTAFGYRLACPDGWETRADGAAAAVMLGLPQGPMKAKLTAAERPAAVTARISAQLRQRDEARLTQAGTPFKRIPCGTEPGKLWACAYRNAAGAAQIAVTALFSYPRGGKHVWIRLQLVAPFTAAKEAGRQMRALVAGFAAESAGTNATVAATAAASGAPLAPVAEVAGAVAQVPAQVNVVGKAGGAEAILLDETGALARVTFEPGPIDAELVRYQNDVFQPVVAMEARLAKLFDDVPVRAERNELSASGKIAMFREIVGRYKKMIEPLEGSVPTQPELAQAHSGVVQFYRERAGIYDRIVESTAKNDSAGTVKAAQELAHHDFQNTQAYQQLTTLAQKASAAAAATPPPVPPAEAHPRLASRN